MEILNESVSLDEGLKQARDLGLEAQRTKLLEADIYLAFGEYEKAIDSLVSYDENAGEKIFSDLVENIKKATQVDDSQTESLRNELFNIIQASTSFCGECPTSLSLDGLWSWSASKNKWVCRAC
ncbi:MAG TPA: hypothetical protein V6D19_20045 [Stenomitos sp.]